MSIMSDIKKLSDEIQHIVNDEPDPMALSKAVAEDTLTEGKDGE